MRTSRGGLVVGVVVLGIAAASVAAIAPVGASTAGEQGAKEVGIRGEVARGAAEDSCIIKVGFGKKKVITYEVAPESPRGRDLLPLIGKTVEATGVMKKGDRGENLFVVTGVADASR